MYALQYSEGFCVLWRNYNLRNHLRDVHKVDFADAAGGDKPKQGGISSFFKPTKVSPARSTSWDDRVMEFVCRDLRPVSVVTGDGFLSLVNFREPGYRVPSATQVTKLIQRKHLNGLKILMEKLSKVQHVALTTDLWTSRRTEGYITVTVHFINPDSWKLESGVLTTCKFADRHTADNIAAKLNAEITRFGLDERVTAIVHDQAANMKKALRLMAPDDKPERMRWTACRMESSGSSGCDSENEDQASAASAIESLECAGHRLQYSLHAGLSVPAIESLLAASRRIVGHFNHSTLSSDALKKKQQGNNKSPKQLVQDWATRWDSAFLMLERLVELRWFAIAVLAEGKADGSAFG